jgi:myxalamid-type polyketide synthase MxaB
MAADRPTDITPLRPLLIDRLRQLPAADRPGVLREALRHRISEALGIDPSDVGDRDRLMDLGVNSMQAVELKIAFERELDTAFSSSLLFDCPTVESLAAFLLAQTRLEPRPSSAPVDDDETRSAELRARELADLRGFVPERQ